MRCFVVLLTVTLMLVTAGAVQAETIVMDYVPVGNAGNAADSTGFGSVSQTFLIGKYEVTAGQYTAFLNAKAASDPHGLYNTGMANPTAWSCNIQRDGTDGTFTYSVTGDWIDRPVNWVSFWDACRFANWMHNGQGNGDTETGAYTLTPETMADNSVTRNPDARVWIPSEDEWYKAAYHKNDGATGNYFLYPTSSDTAPGNDVLDPDPGNMANAYDGIDTNWPLTKVGEFENSSSPYGTFDQAGNVWEWNEGKGSPDQRVLRSGQWNWWNNQAAATNRRPMLPTDEVNADAGIGFRVAAVPEPSTLLLVTSILTLLLFRWSKR